MEALFRLFLAAPEGVKLLALYGRGDQLAAAAECREEFLAATVVVAAATRNAGHKRNTRQKKGPAEGSR